MEWTEEFETALRELAIKKERCQRLENYKKIAEKLRELANIFESENVLTKDINWRHQTFYSDPHLFTPNSKKVIGQRFTIELDNCKDF